VALSLSHLPHVLYYAPYPMLTTHHNALHVHPLLRTHSPSCTMHLSTCLPKSSFLNDTGKVMGPVRHTSHHMLYYLLRTYGMLHYAIIKCFPCNLFTCLPLLSIGHRKVTVMQVAPGQPPPSAGCDYWFDQTYNTQFHTFEDIVDKEVATGELGY